jgi:hypothetical protein
MKQMNQYILLLKNDAEASPLPAAGFLTQLADWVKLNDASADVLRTEASPQAAVSMVCTEDVASRVAKAFAGAVASVRMDRQNVMTFPDPLPRKTRRPGFAAGE